MAQPVLPGHFVSSSPYLEHDSDQEKALYFERDTRVDATTVQIPAIANHIKSVACLIPARNLDNSNPRMFNRNVKTLSQWIKKQREYGGKSYAGPFKKEPVAGFGTAFIVHPKYVLTAAHNVCFEETKRSYDKEMLSKIRIVFDFTGSHEDMDQYQFQEKQIYTIARVVDYVNKSTEEDWALVELDREVEEDRPILPIEMNPELAAGTSVDLLGHPNGLPMKYAEGLSKGEQLPEGSLSQLREFHMDAFAGNSGSPVFDKKHRVIGMLVRGPDDYELVEGKVCPRKASPGQSEKCQAFLPNTPLGDRLSLLSSDNPDDRIKAANRLGCELLLQVDQLSVDQADSKIWKNDLLNRATDLFEQAFKGGLVPAGYHLGYSLYHADRKREAYEAFNQLISQPRPMEVEMLQATKEYLESLKSFASSYKDSVDKGSEHNIVSGKGSQSISTENEIIDKSKGNVVSKDGGISRMKKTKVKGNSSIFIASGLSDEEVKKYLPT